MGIAMSLILPYIEVLALQRVAKESYGKIRLFGSIGFIIIALVVVRFLDGANVALTYLSSFAFLSAFLAFLLSKDSHATKKEQHSLDNDVNILRDYKLWLSLLLMQVSFGAFYNFFTLYETSYGVSLDMTINLWVFGVLVEIVMLYIQGRFLKYNLVTLLEITLGATVVRWGLVYLFPTNLTLLFFSQSLHALSFALFYSSSIMYLHQIYTNKVLAQQFFSGITFGLGGLVGAIMFGYIYELNKEITFLVASGIAFVALVFMVMWGNDKR
jgi:PPP family 3-phenylpropionic acid transporter